MEEIIAAAVLILISIAAFIMSIRSFQEKGFLFNNTYLYASKKERESMDKAPYYRQSAVVFALISLIFLLNGLSLLLHMSWLKYVVAAVIAIALVYAITSSITIEKQNKA